MIDAKAFLLHHFLWADVGCNFVGSFCNKVLLDFEIIQFLILWYSFEQFHLSHLALSSRNDIETSQKVYVGGIPYYSNEDDIRSYFEGCGTITYIDCMTFPDTGKFRGIAFITFKVDSLTG